jgi:uncharacterized protein YgbK (DUF1537 family)
LAAHWRELGLLPAKPSLPPPSAVDAIAVVSGSCSPVTADQIKWARANGFRAERLRLSDALAAHSREAEIERVVTIAVQALGEGTSPLIFSAEGPDDETVTRFDLIAQDAGLARPEAARRIGATLAEVMKRLLDRAHPSRIVVAGGDSSGEVASALDIEALTVAAGLSPGAPLCRAWSNNPNRDGLEIVLKGGQIGPADFFGLARNGDQGGQCREIFFLS